MVIDPSIASRFINEYKRFLLSIYQPESADDDRMRTLDKLHAARKRFIANRGLFDEYMNKLEDGTEPIDRKILLAIRNLEYSRWVYVRDLTSWGQVYIVVLSTNGTRRGSIYCLWQTGHLLRYIRLAWKCQSGGS